MGALVDGRLSGKLRFGVVVIGLAAGLCACAQQPTGSEAGTNLTAGASTPAGEPIKLVARAEARFGESVAGPVPQRAADLALERFFKNRQVDNPVRPVLAGADLDGDGRVEVLALLGGETFCVHTGCELLILKDTDHGLRPLTSVLRVKPPVVVSHRSSRGWRELLVRTGGGGMALKTTALRFGAAGYPGNASVAEAYLDDARANGEVLIDRAAGEPVALAEGASTGAVPPAEEPDRRAGIAASLDDLGAVVLARPERQSGTN